MCDEHLFNKIYLVDTAGFKDTEGSVIDLSNVHGAASAIKSLKAARFVALLSGADKGSRNQGIIEMIHILNGLFPDYEKIKDSVVLVFNRFDY